MMKGVQVDKVNAIRRLEVLAATADLHTSMVGVSRSQAVMCAEAAGIIETFLGAGHPLAMRVAELPSSAPFNRIQALGGPRPGDAFRGYLNAAIGLIDAARTNDTTRARPACDPELWSDIAGLVEQEEWEKVPREVVTFVEDRVRQRAGSPRNKTGAVLFGWVLFRHVLASGSPLALGQERSEKEGWADLGSGLVKAIGNGQRHRKHSRPDAEQFAWGVIGLGSLILGELRREHGE